MVKARKYVVQKHFSGWPKKDDFGIVEFELPPIKVGEILVKVDWISVDPYVRLLNKNTLGIEHPMTSDDLPYDQIGYNVGTVIDSKHPSYPIGTKVVSHEGWRDHYIGKVSEDQGRPNVEHGIYKLPDLKGLSDSLAVGAVGMPGASAYFGFTEVCKPKAGETVVVTGAAGAVGSIVGQIAKIKGCRVIGFAGTDEKVERLENELGFDRAFNYKTVNITEALKEAAPNGIDCFYDNVGGEISTLIMNQMNDFGRVAVSGVISGYNKDPGHQVLAPIVQPAILGKQLTVQGVIVYRWGSRWFEAFEHLITWIKNGQLKAKEHVTEGFENVFEAFVGMMKGDNFGKAVVKL